MCGRLRLEGTGDKAGPGEIRWVNPQGSSWIKVDNHLVPGIWDGHARSETLQKWLAGGWKMCTIPAKAFTEGHDQNTKDFPVPDGMAIQGIYLKIKMRGVDTLVFKIVTRDAVTPEEKAVHPRFPRLV